MAGNVVTINRAPVLTLWGAVVAARMGYSWEEALSLGKAVAGLNAQAKGRRLGIYGPPKGPERGGGEPKKVGLGEDFWVNMVGRPVPVKQTEDGIRAVVKDQPIDPEGVWRYLQGKLRDNLAPVREAMEELAASVSPDDLEWTAYEMYETFRPKIPSGKKGWGAAGELNLDLLRKMAHGAG
jgi:hypothetical protein